MNLPAHSQSRRFDLFGRRIAVEASGSGWVVYYLGDEGKRRRATDIVVPRHVSAGQLQTYLADLCHEWATERHPVVSRLEFD